MEPGLRDDFNNIDDGFSFWLAPAALVAGEQSYTGLLTTAAKRAKRLKVSQWLVPEASSATAPEPPGMR